MRKIKNIDFEVNRYGEVTMTDNSLGNCSVYQGHYGESNIGTPERILEFFKKIIPVNYDIKLYRNNQGIVITTDNFKMDFSFEILKNKVILYYTKPNIFGSPDAKSNPIAELTFKTNYNSLNLFLKLFRYADGKFRLNKFRDTVLKSYPEATEIYNWSTNDYGCGTMVNNGDTLFFILDNDNDKVFVRAMVQFNEYDQPELLYFDNLDYMIKFYQKMQTTLESYRDPEPEPQKSQEELEVERKANNERLKLLPRNPELEKMSTRDLLHYLDLSRKPINDDTDYLNLRHSIEDLKAELSHRDHYPKSKVERKEIRRRQAMENHGSRNSRKD